MLNNFEVSRRNNDNYTFNHKIDETYTLNYNQKSMLNIVENDNGKIISYGYAFDVRNPEKEMRKTLENLLNKPEEFQEVIKFLNGEYILIYNFNGAWNLLTDAACITPVYIDSEKKVVTTNKATNRFAINGFYILNLQSFTITRIQPSYNKLTDERIERIILDLVTNQYKYFEDKDISLFFRRNKMNKALISILNPVLKNQVILARETDKLTDRVIKWIARDYKMQSVENDTKSLYAANTHLMNYNYYINKEIKLDDEQINTYLETYNLDSEDLKSRGKVEFNISTKLPYRNENQDYFIYDPFNVIAIQEQIYRYSDNKKFDPLGRIIKIMNPSLDFYDFATGETLMQKFNKLKSQNAKLKKEVDTNNKNREFLSHAKVRGIEVSNNLDGSVTSDGLTFYPASQRISKDDLFEVVYKKNGKGMVLVESYFDNPKNAHRIKVNINGEQFNINEFLNGKFMNVETDIHITMSYERDYEAVSWQKAGRINIREID